MESAQKRVLRRPNPFPLLKAGEGDRRRDATKKESANFTMKDAKSTKLKSKNIHRFMAFLRFGVRISFIECCDHDKWRSEIFRKPPNHTDPVIRKFCT